MQTICQVTQLMISTKTVNAVLIIINIYYRFVKIFAKLAHNASKKTYQSVKTFSKTWPQLLISPFYILQSNLTLPFNLLLG